MPRHAIRVEVESKNVTSNDRNAAHASGSTSDAIIASLNQPSAFQVVGYLWLGVPAPLYPLADSEIRKDKTLTEILDRIKSLEGKIDSLSIRAPFPATTQETAPSNVSASAALPPGTPGLVSSLDTSIFHSPFTPTAAPGNENHYKYVSSVHEMLGWPIVQQVLESVRPKTGLDLSTISRDGPAMVLGLHDHNQPLPVDSTGSLSQNQPLSFPVQGSGVTSLTIPSLTWDTMQRLGKAYFDTFNLMYPIVDRQLFLSVTMPSVFNEGFNERMPSTIALLIYALGEAAIAGTQGSPIHVSNGRPSGMKGGTATQPPGLTLFNEARKRMGFNLTDCSLGNVQIFALAGYGSNSSLRESCLLTDVVACIMERAVTIWYVFLGAENR